MVTPQQARYYLSITPHCSSFFGRDTIRKLGLMFSILMSSESNEEWKTNQAIACEHDQEGHIQTDYF
jgi:hypothetical protein